MSDEQVTASDTLARRRSAVKGVLLRGAAMYVDQMLDYDDLRDVCAMLELPPGGAEALVAEVSAQLWNRAGRHPDHAPLPIDATASSSGAHYDPAMWAALR